jgi:hypothetical protein
VLSLERLRLNGEIGEADTDNKDGFVFFIYNASLTFLII